MGVCVWGGYKVLRPVEIANCFWSYQEGRISYKGVRVFFGALAVMAVRESATRVAKAKFKKTKSRVRYQLKELCTLTGLKESAVKRELRLLSKSNILHWSESEIRVTRTAEAGSEKLLTELSGKRAHSRPIPFPRTVLRFVARSPKSALGMTMVAYVVRGVSIDRFHAGISSAGTVKASWIADTFAMSLRSVKSARKELIAKSFISKDTASFQRKLNLDGAYFQVNLCWHEGRGEGPKISPRKTKFGANFAPPYKYKKTSYEFKNQKTQEPALKPSGVCTANKKEKPALRDIKPEDLRDYLRVKSLYEQALAAGWVQGSEAEFLDWVAAAVRASTTKAGDAVRVFVWIVKGGHWNFITQAQEDRARTVIAKFREREGGYPEMFHAASTPTPRVAVCLTRLKY